MKNNHQEIGIISFISTFNPGTIFQNYALLTVINNIPNFNASLINYRGNNVKKYAKNSNYFGIISSLLVRLFYFFKFSRAARYNKDFFPILSQRELKRTDLPLIVNRYDQFLCGSDQIWNTQWNGFDKSYFFDFVMGGGGKKKGAYAPSIGLNDWPEEQKEEIKRLLSDFSFIGIREKQGVVAAQALTDLPVHWSLDPTFLLERSDWSKIAKMPKKGEYIFEYCITNSNDVREATERIAKETGLPIIEYGGNRKRVPSAKRINNPDVLKWLGYLLNAKYVVTDSFHGCALSINNNKTFFAIITGMGSRIVSVLDYFNLQDRLITHASDIDLNKEIDWNKVNKKLVEGRTECIEWLKECLQKEQ